VYSLAVLPTGEVVSGAEDRTARVWRDGQCVGTIAHGGSVWSVTALPDGDIATACADGVARVFTRDAAKVADEAVLQAHEAMIQAQTVSAQEVGGVKMDQLPGIEALDTPGGKDGQTKIVRIEDKAYAYSWNSVESKWDQVGTVVDGPAGGGGGVGGAGGSGPGEVNGVKYDRVFDIEIDEGVTLKLGYNNGQNPYAVAQEFIWTNDLPQEHLDQIANFIDKNAAAVTLGGDAPMTQGADPFTGGSNAMYEAPRAAPAGGSASGASTVTFASSEHIPKKSMIFFDTPGKADAVEKKVMEFNDALAAGGATSVLAMTAEEAALLRQLIAVAVDKDSMARPSPAAYDLLANKLLKWPQDKLFPILDVLRSRVFTCVCVCVIVCVCVC
jgi:phospholipase A-2-activating protein